MQPPALGLMQPPGTLFATTLRLPGGLMQPLRPDPWSFGHGLIQPALSSPSLSPPARGGGRHRRSGRCRAPPAAGGGRPLASHACQRVRMKRNWPQAEPLPMLQTLLRAQIGRGDASLKRLQQGLHQPQTKGCTSRRRPKGGLRALAAYTARSISRPRVPTQATASTRRGLTSAKSAVSLRRSCPTSWSVPLITMVR